jgi:hypothetical protein
MLWLFNWLFSTSALYVRAVFTLLLDASGVHLVRNASLAPADRVRVRHSFLRLSGERGGAYKTRTVSGLSYFSADCALATRRWLVFRLAAHR